MRTKSDKNGKEYTVFSFRISLEAYEQMKSLAKKNKRSLNSEMDKAVEQYIESSKEK